VDWPAATEATSVFERPGHRRVLAVLQALQAERLREHRFWFGGGTRIVLELGEYRESHDIDFLCADPGGYAELRQRAASDGVAALFTPERRAGLSFPREIRIDQYGIRFPVEIGGEMLKIELIREARISLEAGIRPAWSPVDCLTDTDCFAEKLLANSDRWPDRQFLSRDLVDLAALRRQRGPIPGEAWDKAVAAYRSAPETDLDKALAAFERDAAYRARCWVGLSVTNREPLEEGLRWLAEDRRR
jgi:hypothetical protein